MLIGLDFDNTIASYDNAIAFLADEFFDLPINLPRTKLVLRDYLRNAKREPEWTAFQGALYGPGMRFAEPFDQAIETMRNLKGMGHSLCIVSHRSRRPYAGHPYDLHSAAQGWITKHLMTENLVSADQVFLQESRQQKIACINRLGCVVFLDDLPEVLGDSLFPKNCFPILFDPEDSHSSQDFKRVGRWTQLPALLDELL